MEKTNGSVFKMLVAASVLIIFTCAPRTNLSDYTLPTRIGPYHEHIYLNGRFDTSDTTGPVCAWTGSAVTIRFKGTAVNALLQDLGRKDNSLWQQERNFLNAVIDDSVVMVIRLHMDTVRYRCATGLADTVHTLTLFKRTEPEIGLVRFLGFELKTTGKILPSPLPPHRRLEVIGNSISCGYGNEGAGHKAPFRPSQENGYMAYGAITARNLAAEYRAVCWSGRGMYRNLNTTTTETMPVKYGRTLPTDTTSQWDLSRWIPDVVVINLGTNDFNRGNPTEKQFAGAYRDFIKRLRGYYPDAHFICLVGTMLNDGWPVGNKALSTIRRYLNNMIWQFKAAGENKVHYVECPPQDQERDGVGSDYHPSVKTHQLMAERLTKKIKEVMNW
jgi:lysophospholipase L1-like esterase